MYYKLPEFVALTMDYKTTLTCCSCNGLLSVKLLQWITKYYFANVIAITQLVLMLVPEFNSRYR